MIVSLTCQSKDNALCSASFQFLQQHLGLLQVCCIKFLSEPAIDLRQHLLGLFLLTLLLPQTTQAHHRPQLQRLCALPAGNVEGLEKTRFGLLETMNDE